MSLIGCQTALTASHCVCDLTTTELCTELVPRDPSRLFVFFQHAGVFAVESIAMHPGYQTYRGGLFSNDNDVAILKLTEPVPGIRPARVNQVATPDFETPATIVGFGQTDTDAVDKGIKREGAVVTAPCSYFGDGHICWSFEEPIGPPGEDSNICYGDSGGPLFVDLGAGPLLAAVHSGWNSGECPAPSSARDQDVFAVRDFILEQAGGDLGTTCGDYPPVGDPGTQSFGFSGTLSGTKPESRHDFEVSPDTSLLRVTLNSGLGGTPPTRDFDLYLKAGAPAEVDDFDCSIAGPGHFDSICELPSPAPGTWHVLVTQVLGEGEYQATAVAVPEPGQILLVVTGALVLLGASRRRT